MKKISLSTQINRRDRVMHIYRSKPFSQDLIFIAHLIKSKRKHECSNAPPQTRRVGVDWVGQLGH